MGHSRNAQVGDGRDRLLSNAVVFGVAMVRVNAFELAPGGTMAAAVNENGVQNELEIWLAPVEQIADPQPAWKPFVTRTDEVTSIHMRGDEIFLLSHKDAPTFKVLTVKAGDVVVVPAGVAHCNQGQSSDLLIVGAYPDNGPGPDLRRGKPAEHDTAAKAVAVVPLATLPKPPRTVA